ncbi:hypothetical protein L9F63_007067, partial [Diploptera punctata]
CTFFWQKDLVSWCHWYIYYVIYMCEFIFFFPVYVVRFYCLDDVRFVYTITYSHPVVAFSNFFVRILEATFIFGYLTDILNYYTIFVDTLYCVIML